MSETPPSNRSAEPVCREPAHQEQQSRTAAEAEGLLRELILAHHAPLYRYAYRLTGQPADAEDLTQQAFLIAQQKLHQLREVERGSAWLYTIVRSCFLKACRKKQPATQVGNWDADDVPAALPSIDSVDQEALAAALGELPDDFRVVVLMFYFEDLSYKEIADQLQLPIGTVMSRLSRAKTHLRRRLEPDRQPDIVHPAASPLTPAARLGDPITRTAR